jgi:carbon monoxide dehydrogenase subunit G
MKVSGTATLLGPAERVYQVLNDPAVLVRTIPGCERLERLGPDEYRMVVSAGVASIKGTYVGAVTLADHDPPHGFTLRASGSGAPGTVQADVKITLDGTGETTTLTYDADAIVGGMVGGVGQRILTGVAKKTAGEFFANVNDVLSGATPAVSPAATAATAATAVTTDGVFQRPPAVARPADFMTGFAYGAGAALLGAIVGGLVVARAVKGRSPY